MERSMSILSTRMTFVVKKQQQRNDREWKHAENIVHLILMCVSFVSKSLKDVHKMLSILWKFRGF